MRTCALGDTRVSAVGSGDVCLGTSAGRGVDAGEVERAVLEAIALDVTLIEVADDAEAMVGGAVRTQRARDKVVVATRIAPVPNVRALIEVVQARVEASLRATRLDALPLAQLPVHVAWTRERAWPELVETCARLVREGKVMRWGALVGDDDARAVTREEGGDASTRGTPARANGDDSSVRGDASMRRASGGDDAPASDARSSLLAVPGDDLAMAALSALDGAAPSADDVKRAIVIAANRPKPSGLIVSLHEAAPAVAPPPPPPVEPGKPAALALCEAWIAALSIRFDLCDRGAGALLDECKAPRLVRNPLAGGALAGALGAGVELRVRDDRRSIDATTLARITLGLATLARFVRDVPEAARATAAGQQRLTAAKREPLEARTIAELALRFAIDRGGIALPRLHRVEHVRAAVAATAAPPLSRDLLADLATLDI